MNSFLPTTAWYIPSTPLGTWRVTSRDPSSNQPVDMMLASVKSSPTTLVGDGRTILGSGVDNDFCVGLGDEMTGVGDTVAVAWGVDDLS